MALVDARPLLEHVIRLGSAGVRSAVGIDVGADVGEKVCTIARLADCGCETLEFATVVLEDFAVAGEVVLFQGRGCEGGFGVEEAGELGDEGVTLFGLVLVLLCLLVCIVRTRSRRSLSCDSSRCSSSVGVGGGFAMEAYWA